MRDKLSAWERIVRMRHARPNARDYIQALFEDFCEMHGDRFYGDDHAIIGGVARFELMPVTVIAHLKGKNLEENIKSNFAMAHPEGYRKSIRLMRQAEKFNRPVICLVDTPGAFCGVDAEERGQHEAIAQNLFEMMRLETPIVSIVIGEGGSGGALALAVCDRLAMMQNSIYSVISPRGCASILWKDPSREEEAANLMKITAEDLYRFQVCEEIIRESKDIEQDCAETAKEIKMFLRKSLQQLMATPVDQLIKNRYQKFRKIGMFCEEPVAAGTQIGVALGN